MKIKIGLALLTTIVGSCIGKMEDTASKTPQTSLRGTWQLITATLIEKSDTVVTDYTRNISFIKIINDTHFAFLQHDLNKGKDSGAVFVAGGGTYSLNDSLYTERLDYSSDRNWEGNDFNFIVTVKNDTLVQRGVEIVESAGVNRINIETYVRVRK